MEKVLELLSSNPELIMPVVREYIAKYKPMVYEMAREVVEIYKDYANNTEYPSVIAKTKKNLYDAYVEVGFTGDQALALMINDNIQLLKNLKQISSNNSKSIKKTQSL